MEGFSFVLDEKSPQYMYIRVNFTKNMLMYDAEKNKFLKSFKINETEGDFLRASNGIMLQSGSLAWRYSSKYYSWKLINTEGKVVYEKKNQGFMTQKQQHL